jgi:hypothetical protein
MPIPKRSPMMTEPTSIDRSAPDSHARGAEEDQRRARPCLWCSEDSPLLICRLDHIIDSNPEGVRESTLCYRRAEPRYASSLITGRVTWSAGSYTAIARQLAAARAAPPMTQTASRVPEHGHRLTDALRKGGDILIVALT